MPHAYASFDGWRMRSEGVSVHFRRRRVTTSGRHRDERKTSLRLYRRPAWRYIRKEIHALSSSVSA